MARPTGNDGRRRFLQSKVDGRVRHRSGHVVQLAARPRTAARVVEHRGLKSRQLARQIRRHRLSLRRLKLGVERAGEDKKR
jgi:hypothetical protein